VLDPAEAPRDPRIGLALCASGAAAWVAAAGLVLAAELRDPYGPASSSLSWTLWGLGIATQMVGAGVLAATPAARPSRTLAWTSCVAFGLSLFALVALVGLESLPSSLDVRSHLQAIVFGWQRCAEWIGTSLLAVVAARMAERRRPWARWLGRAALGVVVLGMLAERWRAVAGMGWPDPWSVFAVRATAPALVVVLCVVAWAPAPAAERVEPAPRFLADAVMAIPLLFAVRAAQTLLVRAVLPGSFDSSVKNHLVRAAAGDQLLGMLMIGAVCAIALGGRRRSPWAWVALSCAALGHLVSLPAGGGAARVVPRLAEAAFGVLGATGATASAPVPVWLDPTTVAHVAGVAAVAAALWAVASLGESTGELDAAGRTRESFVPLLLAAAATMPTAPDSSSLGLLTTLAAIGFCALATWRLLPACVVVSRALLRGSGATTAPAEAPADAEPHGEISTHPTTTHPAPAETFAANPYAAPAADAPASRGRLGSPKLATWRRDVWRAIPWVLGPPIVCSAVTNALALLGGLSGASSATLSGYTESAARTVAALAMLVLLARVVAHALALRAVFVATRAPRVRLPAVGALVPRAARITMSLALAVHAAGALLALAYGFEAAVDLTAWILFADQIAYACIALYGAQLLVAGQRGAQALLLKGLSAGMVLLAIVCFVALQGPHGLMRASQIDLLGIPLVLALGVPGALALRGLLRDGQREFGRRE
jgi:hypothetical protein